MDALVGPLEGPRARGACMIRACFDPPWALSSSASDAFRNGDGTLEAFVLRVEYAPLAPVRRG